MLKELAQDKGQTIVFIDELPWSARAPRARRRRQHARPCCARRALRGRHDPDEYRKYIEKDGGRRRLQGAGGRALGRGDIAILRGLREYGVHHGVDITDPAIVAAAELSHRYITTASPDKAIDLIDGSGAHQDEIDSSPRPWTGSTGP